MKIRLKKLDAVILSHIKGQTRVLLFNHEIKKLLSTIGHNDHKPARRISSIRIEFVAIDVISCKSGIQRNESKTAILIGRVL